MFLKADLTKTKQYISIQWILRSIGAIIGSAISLSLSVDQTKPVGVSTPVYITFIVIHASAIFIAFFFIVNPKNVIREDGTHIAVFKKAEFWPELKGTISVMLDRRYLLTAPAQLACEMALALVSSINCTPPQPSLTLKQSSSHFPQPDISTSAPAQSITLPTKQPRPSSPPFSSSSSTANTSSPAKTAVSPASHSWAP